MRPGEPAEEEARALVRVPDRAGDPVGESLERLLALVPVEDDERKRSWRAKAQPTVRQRIACRSCEKASAMPRMTTIPTRPIQGIASPPAEKRS